MHAGHVVAHYDALMGVEVWMRQTGHRYAFCYAAVSTWSPATYIQCDHAWRVVLPDEIPDDYPFES